MERAVAAPARKGPSVQLCRRGQRGVAGLISIGSCCFLQTESWLLLSSGGGGGSAPEKGAERHQRGGALLLEALQLRLEVLGELADVVVAVDDLVLLLLRGIRPPQRHEDADVFPAGKPREQDEHRGPQRRVRRPSSRRKVEVRDPAVLLEGHPLGVEVGDDVAFRERDPSPADRDVLTWGIEPAALMLTPSPRLKLCFEVLVVGSTATVFGGMRALSEPQGRNERGHSRGLLSGSTMTAAGTFVRYRIRLPGWGSSGSFGSSTRRLPKHTLLFVRPAPYERKIHDQRKGIVLRAAQSKSLIYRALAWLSTNTYSHPSK